MGKGKVELLRKVGYIEDSIRELENIIERIMISFDGEIITKFQVERAIGVPQESTVSQATSIEGKSMAELLEEYERYILEISMAQNKKAADVARNLRMNK